LPKPTRKISPEHFQELRDYLTQEQFNFEERPNQVFLARKTGVVLSLYASGNIVVDGGNSALVNSLYEYVVSLGGQEVTKELHELPPLELPFPHIGTDEVGKGDYFGPLVVAGALVPAEAVDSLTLLGVRDSKTLSDTTVRNLASQARILLGSRRIEEIAISPFKYNVLYQKMRNVNRILGWAHAKAIENLLANGENCELALADQFGDPGYIRDSLMSRGKRIELKQATKAERDKAVATASILARDTFLRKREEMSESYHVVFPKGATDVVEFGKKLIREHGMGILPHVAKLHFSTTLEITGGEVPIVGEEIEKQMPLDQVSRVLPEREREDLRLECYSMVSNFEGELRRFIEQKLSQEFGDKWWNVCVREDIRGKAEGIAEQDRKKGRKANPVECLFFPDYETILLDDNNWNRVFKGVFKNKDQLRARLTILKPYRDSIAHSRGTFVSKDRTDIFSAITWIRKMMLGQSTLEEF
jgi:ribonuclease HIII